MLKHLKFVSSPLCYSNPEWRAKFQEDFLVCSEEEKIMQEEICVKVLHVDDQQEKALDIKSNREGVLQRINGSKASRISIEQTLPNLNKPLLSKHPLSRGQDLKGICIIQVSLAVLSF